MVIAFVLAIVSLGIAPASAAVIVRTLDVTPEAGAATGGLPATLTATVSVPADAVSGPIEIDFEIEGGPNDIVSLSNAAGYSPSTPDLTCTVLVATSACTVSYTPATNSLDQIRGWIHIPPADRTTEVDSTEGSNETLLPGTTPEQDNTDVVNVLVTGGAPARTLDCSDSNPVDGTDTATAPTTGDDASTHITYTCLVTSSGSGVPNVVIDGENLTASINDADAGKVAPPDFSCTTTAQGSCTMIVPTTTGTLTAGTATICFWIDSNNDDAVDSTDPANGGNCSEPVAAPENDNETDTVSATWQTRTGTTVDITNEDDARILPAQTTHTVNISVKDQFGAVFGGVNVDFYIIGGPNHDSGNLVTRDCTSASDGVCTVTYTSNGSNGIDRFCAWIDVSPNDLYSPTGPAGDGGQCASEPTTPGTDGGNAATDVGQVTWSGGVSNPAQLEVTPEVAPGGAVAQGTEYSLTGTVKDENGTPMAGKIVNFEISGAGDPDSGYTTNTPDRTCTTAANGSCALSGAPGALGSSTTFTSATQGTATIRAWVDGATPDEQEGADAGPSPDEPSGTPDTPGNTVEPDTTDVVLARFGRIATTLTGALQGSTNTGVYGFDPMFAGTLTDDVSAPIVGATVSLYQRNIGSSVLVLRDTTTTNASGAYSFTDTNPPASSDYQISYSGDGEHLASQTSLIRVNIRAGVIFNVNPLTLPRNRPATLSGKIVPGHPGKKVSLQWYQGQQGTWATQKTVTLDANSNYNFKYTRNGPGFLIFRIVYGTQDSDHLWNISRNLKITWT